MEKIKMGIIICDHFRTCSGGKCFKALHNKEGAFEAYKGQDVELAAFATCGGCPGTNIEYANDEMTKNGITHIHFATCFSIGYPPCSHKDALEKFFINKKMNVTFGTHPIPQKYYILHTNLRTWNNEFFHKNLKSTLANEKIRLKYD